MIQFIRLQPDRMGRALVVEGESPGPGPDLGPAASELRPAAPRELGRACPWLNHIGGRIQR